MKTELAPVVKTQYSCPLALYKEYYGFSPAPLSPVREEVFDFAALARTDPSPIRRKLFGKKTQSLSRPIHQNWDQITIAGVYMWFLFEQRWGWIVEAPKTSQLWLGGLMEPVSYYGAGGTRFIANSVYIGNMPQWVWERYKEAEREFGRRALAVISRDKRLFEPASIQSLVSPLLIAGVPDRLYRRESTEENQELLYTGRIYLIAAWDLEHELPKSLGGLLEG